MLYAMSKNELETEKNKLEIIENDTKNNSKHLT